jgi:CheY-like chemotaxis protein
MLECLIGEDVKVVLKLRPEVAAVRADRGQLEQVVMNLAINARDAMPDGGVVTIETANVALDAAYARTHLSLAPGSYVALTVTDTGCGMTHEVQGHLFEPFFTTKARGKGTGLGLATVHGIVTQSGGSVNVYSEVGRGSSFRVYLPMADASPLQVAPLADARPRTAAVTVLVVEDSDGLRELARRLLEDLGHTAVVAANAEEATRLFKTAAIDVLLTDVVMPGTSGPDLASRLLEEQPTLRVVYMSGYTEDAIVQRGGLDPGVVFLHKPFSVETLDLKIREAVER